MGSLIGDQDAKFHDSIACEVIRLAGTQDITYFALLHDQSPRDPLYDEPLEELHETDKYGQHIGVCIAGFIEYPETTTRAGEEGQVVEFDANLWVARKAFENAFENVDWKSYPNVPRFREPRIGDVVRVQETHYDILNINRDGQLNDTISQHVGWSLKLKYRTTFDPKRRLETA